MAKPILVFLFLGGVGFVAAAQRLGSHAVALERLGGLMLVSGLVALGFELAHGGG